MWVHQLRRQVWARGHIAMPPPTLPLTCCQHVLNPSPFAQRSTPHQAGHRTRTHARTSVMCRVEIGKRASKCRKCRRRIEGGEERILSIALRDEDLVEPGCGARDEMMNTRGSLGCVTMWRELQWRSFTLQARPRNLTRVISELMLTLLRQDPEIKHQKICLR